MKVAIAHDWLTNMGGAEKVIINFKQIYPKSPVYTLVYNEKNLDKELQNIKVKTSFLQNIKNARINHQKYFPLMPVAWEQFDFNKYDVVLSSSSSCAKGIITSPNTMHICYCHSPMRYGWEFYYEYKNEVGKIKRAILPYFMNYMRMWDVISSNRVDYFIANSQNVANRIWKHYRRKSDVIHPPVKCDYFNISDVDEEYFLIVSRLVPYKKVDLAVKTFNEINLPLVVIGGGSQYEYLKSIANSNVKILGRQDNETIKEYYSKCRAFIFPGEEDFGITPLEAQASGRPVIAFSRGGALETVIDGQTGIFFKEQTINSLKEAIIKFQKINFNKHQIREHSFGFDEKIFKRKIQTLVKQKYQCFNRDSISIRS